MNRFLTVIIFITLFFGAHIQAQTISQQIPNNVQVAFPFLDDAENTATSYTYWTRDTNVWQIKSANAHSGSQVWEMLPTSGTYVYLTLASGINLSPTSNPYLAFWTRKADGGTGALTLEASTDGGTTWTAITQPSFSGFNYTHIQAPLSNYRQTNTLVRIGCYAPYGGTYFIDDIVIDNAPTPQPFVLSAPTNNGMHLHWSQSTATDYFRYRVVLSTDQNSLTYGVTPGVSGHGETVVFDIFNKATTDTTLTDLTFANTQYFAKVYEEDSQNLVNQGSDRSDLATSFNVTSEVAPFIENFEGTYKWAADLPWAVTTADASDPGHSTTHAFEDSPNGNYPVNADRRLVVQINLAGVTRPALRFNHKYTFEQGADYGYLEYSGDNVNWTTITGFTGNSGAVWEKREFDAGTLKNQSTGYIRFRTVSNGATQQDGWHLDDVEIFNNTKVTAFPFFDNVAVDTTSRKLWLPGVFDIKSANDHSGDGNVWALPPAGGTYNYLTLAGKLNLSGAPNPYLSFWVKKSDNGVGALTIEASNDAGLTWNVLSQPSFNGSQYTWLEASLANYAQANVLVRIGCYSPYGSNYYIDDILIDNAPTPHPITLLSPTNNGMRLKWITSTAADFNSYRIVISTDPNSLNYFVTPGINGHAETRIIDIFNKSFIDTTLTDLTFANTHYYAKIYETDTQGLINQGSDVADLFTAFTVTSEVAPFTETFEGAFSWAADIPWAVTTDDAADPGHSSTHAFEDSPGGNYPPNADRRLVLQVNLANVTRPVLLFNHKYTFEQNADVGYLEYSGDNVNWTTVTGFTGNSGAVWEKREFDAGTLKNQNTGFIRFRTVSNGTTQQDGWHLDDIQIYNNLRHSNLPLVDSVEVDTTSRKYWLPGMWSIKGLNAHSGTQVWALPPAGGTYNYITLAGEENLSSAPKPYFSFWIKKADNGTGALTVEVSNDAGLTWNILQQPSFSGADYVNFIYSLTNYRQPHILLRIGAYSPYGSTYLLDDITIADSTGFTGINDLKNIIPTDFQLSQNYPNPFNPSTVIRYSLPYASKVELNIYNALGQEVMPLKNEINSAGIYEVQFKASSLPSGVYFYQLKAEPIDGKQGFSSTKKMILMK